MNFEKSIFHFSRASRAVRGLLRRIAGVSASQPAPTVNDHRVELERRISALAATAPGALCSFQLRPDGSVSMPYVSPKWEEYYGLSQKDVEQDATAIFSRIHPEDTDQVKQTIQHSAETMTPWRAEFRVRKPSSDDIWVEGHSTPIAQADGSIIWHGFITDISERKRVADELLAAKDAAERAAQSRAQFLNVAAHELRTPVTSISLILQLAARKEAAGESVPPGTFDKLRLASDRLEALVSDLLELSRLERGVLPIRLEDTNLSVLLSEVIEEFRLRAPKRLFDFRRPADPVVLSLDRVRITQVVSNLLDNAVKYTPEAGPIEISIVPEEGRVRVSVADRGPGLPAESQKHIFDAFAKGTPSKIFKTGGLGLGLAICKKIVELHRGEIGVTSVEGQGSCFYFELPYGRGNSNGASS